MVFADTRGVKEAMHYETLDNGSVTCHLCAHNCIIAKGKTGVCGVRLNDEGKLYSMVYGLASAIHTDPIEKKPLFHFYPSTMVTSFATVGCNFKCSHCQNWDISQASIKSPFLREISVKDAIKYALRDGAQGVAWTYNEPTIWYEFTLEASKLAKKKGLYSVYVTNGYIEKVALEEHAPYLDAMNIDVKAFTEEFYNRIVKAKLRPVLDTVRLAKDLGIFIELTYLIIPTLNDSKEEIRNFIRWVRDKIDPLTPIHFSRFHPDYMLTHLPPTPIATIEMAYNLAMEEGLKYVYTGNVWDSEKESTYCHNCGALLIKRQIYSINVMGLEDNRCRRCGAKIPIVR